MIFVFRSKANFSIDFLVPIKLAGMHYLLFYIQLSSADIIVKTTDLFNMIQIACIIDWTRVYV